MKYRLIFFVLLPAALFVSCTNSVKSTHEKYVILDTIYVCDTIHRDYNWQENFGLKHKPDIDSIWHKPVSYYIDDPACSPVAQDFYFGQFRPGDNRTTAYLLSLAYTQNNKLRPFYRWCLSKTIDVQDGALGEYTGSPAQEYAERFPKELIGYLSYDTTGSRYKSWAESILYSGKVAFEHHKATYIRKKFFQKMKSNCTDCDSADLHFLQQFAYDCTCWQ